MIRRIRPALYVLGATLVIGSLVGARALTAGNGEAPKAESVSGNAARGSGPIVLGTVDSDPPPVAYGLPPVIQSGTISKVFVKNGQEIKAAGEELYAFDTSIQQRDLERAELAVEMARTKVTDAKEAVKQHAKKVLIATEGVSLIKKKADAAAGKYNLIRENARTLYKAEGFAENTWEDRLSNEPKAFEAKAEWNLAIGDWDLKKAELSALESADVNLLVKQAEVGVRQAQAEVAKAQTAVDLCIVKSKTAGTIEQITISPGATLGIGTRTPALWLIPAGPRVVRAEVEADFAHRVSPTLIGKNVVIYDNSDPRLTYKGKVRRVGETFLPKRTANEATMLGNDTRVLEAEVEVIDVTPADKVPLRVGQRVRVDMGQ